MNDYNELYDLIERSSETSSVTCNYLSLALGILMIVALWQIFVKAGERGWASLIPYYKSYVLYKISGKKKLFWWYLACSIVETIACIGFFIGLIVMIVATLSPDPYLYSDDELGAYGLLLIISLFFLLICSIAMFVFRIFQCIGLANNFGLSNGYIAGLIFLPHIFYAIVAFNSNIRFLESGSNYSLPPFGIDSTKGQTAYNQQPLAQTSYNQQQYSQSGSNQQPFAQQGYNQQQYNRPDSKQQPFAQQSYNQQQYSQSDSKQQPFGQQGYNQQQFGQTSFSQQPSAQASYDQQQFGQTNFSQQPSAQVSYDQQQFGQTSFSQQPSAQASYDQQQFGQTSFSQQPSAYDQQQFGQTSFSQQPSAQTNYDQQQFGQTSFNQQPSAQTSYSQQQFGQTNFSQQPSAQTSFSQQQFGQAETISSTYTPHFDNNASESSSNDYTVQ
jgi:hypothetical protein